MTAEIWGASAMLLLAFAGLATWLAILHIRGPWHLAATCSRVGAVLALAVLLTQVATSHGEWSTLAWDQSILSLSLATLVIWQALRTVPKETLEMATVDGAGPWTRLLLVALPQRRAALAAAWLVALAIAMGDVAATASHLVTPAGIDLLSRRIAGMLHASVSDQIAGICLTNAALFVVIAAAVIWLVSPRRRGF